MRDPGVGSFFPYPAAEPLAAGYLSDAPADWPPDSWLLVNSGRAALTTIVLGHLKDHPRARLWMPSYYCWDVTRYVAQWIPVVTYPCRPPMAPLPAEVPGDDLLLVTSYFGATPQRSTAPIHQVILDVTHDPLAEWVPDYGAGWLFGSLRKTLPLPEGGFVYSSLRSAAHLEAPHARLKSSRIVSRGAEAMSAKRRWIDGHGAVSKEAWYHSLQEHEAAISTLQPAAIQVETLDLLRKLPIRRWRHQRLENLRVLRDSLTAAVQRLALPSTFGVPLVLADRESAEKARRMLTRQRVYPARLWPQPDDSPFADLNLADRMVFLHTDHRYGARDMERVAAVVNEAWDNG